MLCQTCGHIPNISSAFEKFGEDDNTSLDSVLKVLVRTDKNPDPSAQIRTYECPTCHAVFNYTSEHDYYVTGSEDSEDLVRAIPLPESSTK